MSVLYSFSPAFSRHRWCTQSCTGALGNTKEPKNVKLWPDPGAEVLLCCSLPRKKQSTPAPRQGPGLPKGGHDRAKPGSEPGVLPSRVRAAQGEQQQQGSGKETEGQQGRQQDPGTVEGQAPEGHQVMSTETWQEWLPRKGRRRSLLGPPPLISCLLLSVAWPCHVPSLCGSLGYSGYSRLPPASLSSLFPEWPHKMPMGGDGREDLGVMCTIKTGTCWI